MVDDQRMRLVLVSDADLADPEGSFWPAQRLSEELRRRGLRVLHASGHERSRPSLERMGGVPVRRLTLGPAGKGPVGRAAFRMRARWVLRRWLPELRERPPDLLHAHLSMPSIWLAAHAAGALGVPWALTVSDGPAPLSEPGGRAAARE